MHDGELRVSATEVKQALDLVLAIDQAIEQLPALVGRCWLRADHDLDALIAGDAERIQLALINMLSTAALLSHPDTVIEIYMCRVDHALAVIIDSQSHHFPTESVTRILDWLEQPVGADIQHTSRMTLPLHVAQGIIEAHGGDLWTVCLPNVLTRIHFTLPV